MLKDQLIEMSWANTNRKWYESKGYIYTKNRDKFYVQAKDLTLMSNKRVIVICDYCNEETTKTFSDYTVSKKSVITKDACANCKVKKSTDSIKETYGVDHQSQLDWVITKIKNSEKLTYEEVYKTFEDRNCKLLSSNYHNAKDELEYVCLKHPKEIQKISLDGFKTKKYNCYECMLDGNLIKMKISYTEELSKRNLIVNDIFRKEDSIYLSVSCEKHYNEKPKIVSVSNVSSQIYTCAKCASEGISRKRRHDLNYVADKFIEKGYTLLNLEDYENNLTPLNYICLKHSTLGEQTTNFANINNSVTCAKCKYDSISRENHYLWKGGISPLHNYMRDKISEWKRDSLKEFNYECAITSSKNDLVVHHIYNYSDILNETLNELKLKARNNISLYSDKELEDIEKLLIHKHYEYGFGIPLNSSIHELFHSIYGKRNNTYEQLEEFKNKYINGEFRDVV